MSLMKPNHPFEKENDFYRQLLANSAIALLATDREFNIVCWNSPAEKFLNLSPDLIGKSVYAIVPDTRHKLLEKLLNRTFQKGETSHFEICETTPEGEELNLMFILSPIGEDSESRLGVSIWIVDETRRTRLAERLSAAEKMASLGTLAGGVAHHFNNILGGVATFVDFALTRGDIASMKRALRMTSEAAIRASKITQSLLSFAKEDVARADLADLTEIVLTFSHLVERPLEEHNIHMKVDLQPVPVIALETNRMHQALGNLLSNAEEALPNGGEICISIRTGKANEVILTFEDNGIGIPPENLPQIFEPFFTTKGIHAGGEQVNPGLGLSVVHGIILEMGARIEVESTPGEGTRFQIHFPIPFSELS
jgi:PAS domain S-box-containing protein